VKKTVAYIWNGKKISREDKEMEARSYQPS